MPRKGKASSGGGGGAASAAASGGPAEAAGAAGGEAERTFTAPSGKHYVITQDSYPHEFPPEIRDEVVAAAEGDLLELFMMHAGMGYGKRFKVREGVVNEGVFRLEWVKGVRLVMEDGKRRPVEVDIHGPDFGFQPPKGSDTASKLRIKRYRKKIDDVAKFWSKADEASVLAKQEAAAAEAAAALERADASERSRKQKTQRQKQQREQQREQQQQAERERGQNQQQSPEGPALSKSKEEALRNQFRELLFKAVTSGSMQAALERPPSPSQLPEDDEDDDAGARFRIREVLERAISSGRMQEAAGRPFSPPARRSDRSEGEMGGLSPSSARGGSSCSGSSPEASGSGSRGERRRVAERTWNSRWEKQAAQLEAVLSASSSGVDEGDDNTRPEGRRKSATRKFTRTLLTAKRSGELQAIAEEWEKAHSEMANKAQSLSALKEKVRRSLEEANTKDPAVFERIIEEVATEAQQKAAEVRELKERVFKAMIAMKRSRNLERTTSDMDEAQKALEMRAFQLKKLMKRAWKGMVESKRRRELERIADEMSEQFTTTAESLRNKVRKGLLRAYRAGELQEIIQEFGEMADSVPVQGMREPDFDCSAEAPRTPPPTRRRWAEFSSDSDTLAGGEQAAGAGPAQHGRHHSSSPAEADVSGSDADSSAGPNSPSRL